MIFPHIEIVCVCVKKKDTRTSLLTSCFSVNDIGTVYPQHDLGYRSERMSLPVILDILVHSVLKQVSDYVSWNVIEPGGQQEHQHRASHQQCSRGGILERVGSVKRQRGGYCTH